MDILPDVIGGVESALREGCPSHTCRVRQVFLNAGSQGIFDRCFSNTSALPRINIGADVWGESNIMTGVY